MIDSENEKLLNDKHLQRLGSVAQAVEQRPFKPKSLAAQQPKNNVFPHVISNFPTSPEGEAKAKRALLARTLARAPILTLVRPVYFVKNSSPVSGSEAENANDF